MSNNSPTTSSITQAPRLTGFDNGSNIMCHLPDAKFVKAMFAYCVSKRLWFRMRTTILLALRRAR